jgi:uncharacterized Zn-finger protein
MSKDPIHVTENVASCSDNGQHPLVYIRLVDGKGMCQYCGQTFINIHSQPKEPPEAEKKTGT